MATDAQIQANRENAKKSTGPRTPEGKARVSKNAFKHGLPAQDSVIPGEDPAKFDRHLATYEDTYLPRNCVEKEIVRQIGDAAWRMRRLSRIEAALITADIERTRVYQEKVRRDRIREGRQGDLQLLGAAMLSGTKFLNDLARYDGHLNGRFYRAVELMMKIRREEAKSRQPRPGPQPDNGFDVYRFPENESDPTVEYVSGPAQAEQAPAEQAAEPAQAQPQEQQTQSQHPGNPPKPRSRPRSPPSPQPNRRPRRRSRAIANDHNQTNDHPKAEVLSKIQSVVWLRDIAGRKK